MADFLFNSWAEFAAFVFMFIGIFIAFLSPSAFISYLIILLAGMIAGRILYERRRNTRTPYVMIITGFVAGFTLVSVVGGKYGNPFIIMSLFIVGIIVMYQVSERGVLPDTLF